MELKPWEFSRLQPGEFIQLWDGYLWRHEQTENMAAYFICSLMNVSGKSLKKAITPKELLKPLRGDTANKKDDADYLKELFKDRLKGGQTDGNCS